jgi:fructan beta-fructosidase
VGSFDGEVFASADETSAPRWADHGADLYATHTWSDTPDDRRIWVGWLNNWRYADRIPSGGWRGGLTVPRELGLVRDGSALLLTQEPVAELAGSREPLLCLENLALQAARPALVEVHGLHLDVVLELELGPQDREQVGLVLAVGDDEGIAITYDPVREELALDRRRSGDVGCDPAFAAEHRASYRAGGRLRLRVVLDGSSVEVFAGDGRLTLTDLVFPSSTSTGLALVGADDARILRLEVARLSGASGRVLEPPAGALD